MQQISKPSNKNYWVARTETGDVLHVGETSPDQVTSTGQPVFEYTDDEESYLMALNPFADKFPDLPGEGVHIVEGQIYNNGGKVVKANKDHKRTGKPVEEEMPENWKKGQ